MEGERQVGLLPRGGSLGVGADEAYVGMWGRWEWRGKSSWSWAEDEDDNESEKRENARESDDSNLEEEELDVPTSWCPNRPGVYRNPINQDIGPNSIENTSLLD